LEDGLTVTFLGQGGRKLAILRKAENAAAVEPTGAGASVRKNKGVKRAGGGIGHVTPWRRGRELSEVSGRESVFRVKGVFFGILWPSYQVIVSAWCHRVSSVRTEGPSQAIAG